MEAPVLYTWDPTQRRHSIGGIRALAFSPDGNLLAAGGIGQIGNIDHLEGPPRVEVFDWQKGQKTHEFPGEGSKGMVERLIFHPDGDRLVAIGGANDGFVAVLDLKAKSVLVQQKAPAHIYDAAPGETPRDPLVRRRLESPGGLRDPGLIYIAAHLSPWWAGERKRNLARGPDVAGSGGFRYRSPALQDREPLRRGRLLSDWTIHVKMTCDGRNRSGRFRGAIPEREVGAVNTPPRAAMALFPLHHRLLIVLTIALLAYFCVYRRARRADGRFPIGSLIFCGCLLLGSLVDLPRGPFVDVTWLGLDSLLPADLPG